jgi:hypothetical protein
MEKQTTLQKLEEAALPALGAVLEERTRKMEALAKLEQMAGEYGERIHALSTEIAELKVQAGEILMRGVEPTSVSGEIRHKSGDLKELEVWEKEICEVPIPKAKTNLLHAERAVWAAAFGEVAKAFLADGPTTKFDRVAGEIVRYLDEWPAAAEEFLFEKLQIRSDTVELPHAIRSSVHGQRGFAGRFRTVWEESIKKTLDDFWSGVARDAQTW